tara:strand:- start:125 stop:1465 length:1341 start_codon:yes stop_codon:yes gene_type:complete
MKFVIIMVKYLKAIYLVSISFLIISSAMAETRPLKIEVNKGREKAIPIAMPSFVTGTDLSELAENMISVITDDLEGTGLFLSVNRELHNSLITNFDSPIVYSNWNAINARILLTGELSSNGTTSINVKFRLFDILLKKPFREGLKFTGPKKGWRRMAHKIADEVYSRVTGESKYFDTRIVFVAEEGSKKYRTKRLVLMDYDGANQAFLTEKTDFIVMGPKFSPSGTKLLYTSYETGLPRISILDIRSRKKIILNEEPKTMSFSPIFSPNGQDVVFSLTSGSNTDLYKLNIASGSRSRLTSSVAIETSPSFSPDGNRLVFESDRSGSQQIYIMPSAGGHARRISFGSGSYGTPVWSPSGDLIAFTKKVDEFFHIGVMDIDGSNERLLTSSFLDESPTWAPNGRVLMFSRLTPGSGGSSTLYSVDIDGRSLKPIRASASDPAWSNLLN